MLKELGHDLSPLEEVRETILSSLEPLPDEVVPLGEAWRRVLREDLEAKEPVPPFDNSAMDGYAVRVADIEGATTEQPVTLRVAGASPAGSRENAPLEPGTTVRIMTGAPMPPDADAVVPHELTRFDDESATFLASIPIGKNVRFAGGDLRPGDVPLRCGTVLHGPRLAMAASLGYPQVRVTRLLRVAIVSPGSELVELGAPCGPGQITNSNAYSLRGALGDVGAEVIDLGIIPDTEAAVRDAFTAAARAGADAVVTTGGASAGDYDFVQKVVREDGSPGHVFKVAMRPGKPLVFGRIAGMPVFGLPGNPAAAILSFAVFVRPALRRLRGEAEVLDAQFLARFPFPFRYKKGRVFLLRTRVEPDDASAGGGFRVAPPDAQDSSFLAGLGTANAIVFLPPDQNEVKEGALRPAVWLGGSP